MEHQPVAACVPNTCQWTAHTERGDYLVQVAWPLPWGEDRTRKDDEPFQTIYLVDGNAYFFTAVDITRRLEFMCNARTIVVAVGYPPGKWVYDFRRGPDLTPPATEYEPVLDGKGQPRTDIKFGEADMFADFIQETVIPHVEDTLFSSVPIKSARRALFGHSYGGIFALNTLFTRPTLFDTFIAASPITWWNKDFLRRQEEAFCNRSEQVDPAPSLVVTWGSAFAECESYLDETEDGLKKRKECSEDDRIREYSEALVSRLTDCSSVGRIWKKEFRGEDHGSAAVTGLQQGIMSPLSKFHAVAKDAIPILFKVALVTSHMVGDRCYEVV